MSEPDVADNNQTVDPTPLTKAERKKRQRGEKQQQRGQGVQARQQKQLLHTILLWIGVGGATVLVGWLIVQSLKPNPDLISRSGIHWHADLIITVKGQPVEIPANIGLGAVHADMHTHQVNDQIHIEMARPVRQGDTRLGTFFETWGKQFSATCILDACNGSEGTVKMLVNGKESTEFENYLMQDQDRIEIRYE